MQLSRCDCFSPSLRLLSSTVDLLTVKFQANKQPRLTNSPLPIGPSDGSAGSYSSSKPCIALYPLVGY